MLENSGAHAASEPHFCLSEAGYHALHDVRRFVELLAQLARPRAAVDKADDYRLAVSPEALAQCLSRVAPGLSEPLERVAWSGISEA